MAACTVSAAWPATPTRNQIWSLGGGYANGPLILGAAYLIVRNPNVSFYGSSGTVAPATAGVPGSNFGNSPVISGYASAHTLQVIGAGASYTFGAATIGATIPTRNSRDSATRPRAPRL